MQPGDWLAAAVVAAVFVQLFVCFGDIAYYDENGQVELAQCALLFLAVILFAHAAQQAKERVTNHLLFALSVFALTFLFRELEVESTRFGPLLEFTRRYELKYVVLGLLWLALLAFALRHLRASLATGFRYLLTVTGRCLLAGCTLYLLGDAAEKQLIVADPALSRMIEESLETFGTLAIFLSAYGAWRRRVV